jgi:hypothetical protein
MDEDAMRKRWLDSIPQSFAFFARPRQDGAAGYLH